MNRLSKSGIDYLDYVWNFESGCTHGGAGRCALKQYCWARVVTERFPDHYPQGFKPALYPESFEEPIKLRQPAGTRVGVCFMGDLFQEDIDPNQTTIISPTANIPFVFFSTMDGRELTLRDIIFRSILKCPQYVFIFLTKNPRGLLKWGKFPSNCWVGISLTSPNQEALDILEQVDASLRFLSIEPMFADFSRVNLKNSCVKWIIIGACTGSQKAMADFQHGHMNLFMMQFGNKYSLQPPTEWVKALIDKSDEEKIPVFLKGNLKPRFRDLWPNQPWAYVNGYYTSEKHPWVDRHLRQEYPKPPRLKAGAAINNDP